MYGWQAADVNQLAVHVTDLFDAFDRRRVSAAVTLNTPAFAVVARLSCRSSDQLLWQAKQHTRRGGGQEQPAQPQEYYTPELTTCHTQ